MQIYCVGKSNSAINTYDIVNNPPYDDYCENPINKPDESSDYKTVQKN